MSAGRRARAGVVVEEWRQFDAPLDFDALARRVATFAASEAGAAAAQQETHVTDIPLAAALMTKLKEECERQHARAEKAERERDEARLQERAGFTALDRADAECGILRARLAEARTQLAAAQRTLEDASRFIDFTVRQWVGLLAMEHQQCHGTACPHYKADDERFEAVERVVDNIAAILAPAPAPGHVHDFEPDGRCVCGEHIAQVPHRAPAPGRPGEDQP